MTDVPILDKGIDDWGEDEQEKAYDKQIGRASSRERV